MLELIRLKQLRVRQESHFGEIWIDRVSEPSPAAFAEN
jgi:chromatin segregation and condensation protein Rec8/ScpA/Scc1 (kleisin family)